MNLNYGLTTEKSTEETPVQTSTQTPWKTPRKLDKYAMFIDMQQTVNSVLNAKKEDPSGNQNSDARVANPLKSGGAWNGKQ